MIVLGVVFFFLITALSIALTKDIYNIFLLSNIVFLSTLFLFPFLGVFFDFKAAVSLEGEILLILYYLINFVGYLLGRKSVGNSSIAAQAPVFNASNYVRFVFYVSLSVNIALILYSIKNYGFSGAFLNSRDIYTTTRAGSGQIYYIASIFFSLYVLTGLFLLKNKWIHLIICIAMALPYGTKAKILTVILYFVVYYFFVNRKRLSFRNPLYLVLLVSFVFSAVYGAFWYTGIGLGEDFSVMKFAVLYGNEYGSNFHYLVNNFDHFFPNGHTLGKILVEDNTYSFIPRVLWPGKPMYSGSLYLSLTVFPEATIADVGAPSFGVLGATYADFGFWGSIIFILIEQTAVGYLLGRYEMKCIKYPTVLNFILLVAVTFEGIVGVPALDRLVLKIMNIVLILLIFFPLWNPPKKDIATA